MKIKRYLAPDLQQAIRMVREEQGPDAVILSNKRLENGVELVAAVDYKEGVKAEIQKTKSMDVQPKKPAPPVNLEIKKSLITQLRNKQSLVSHAKTQTDTSSYHVLKQVQNEIKILRGLVESQMANPVWTKLQPRKTMRAELLKRLVNLGLSSDVCGLVMSEIDSDLPEDFAWRTALNNLIKKIPVRSDQHFKQGKPVALLGMSGVGKTTIIAKIASRFALKHGSKKVRLLSADNIRIGAQEQLKVYAKILGISMDTINNRGEFESILKQSESDNLILIDTPGVKIRHFNVTRQFSFLMQSPFDIKKYLVFPANAQRSDLEELVRIFSGIQVDGCIITKLDECTRLGGVLSVAITNGLPIAYTSQGQRVPEDLQSADAVNLVGQCVTLAQSRIQQFGDERLALEFGVNINDTAN